MTIRVPRELVSPNKWNGRHWREKHRLSQGWEHDIWAITAMKPSGLPINTRRRVQVTREAPSRRKFIRDTDNLFGACKPLCDALKRLRLIVDDSVEWLELVQPQQRVSTDGVHWTVIEISVAG